MPDIDLDPKHVRHRNHVGHEPVFQPGGCMRVFAFLVVIALSLALATLLSTGLALTPFSDWMYGLSCTYLTRSC